MSSNFETEMFLLNHYFPELAPEDGAEFIPAQLNYQTDFPLPGAEMERLRENIAEREQIVELVTVNTPRDLRPAPACKAYVLLGRRAPGEGETGRFAVGTWAPVMGFMEEKDLDYGVAEAELRKEWGRKYTLGDLIEQAAFRERLEEVDELSVQSTMILAEPYLHVPTSRTVHTVAEIVQAVSASAELGILPGLEQLTDGKRTLMKTACPKNAEHTDFAWFRLGDLPEEMHPWSRRAVLLAVAALVKAGYLDVEAERDLRIEEEVPRRPSFLLGEHDTGDKTVDFFHEAFPFLFSAFYRWRKEMAKLAPEEVRGYLNVAINDLLEFIDLQAQIISVLVYGVRDPKMVIDHFPVELSGIKIPQTVQEAEETIEVWWELMGRKTWEQVDPNFPRLARVTSPGFVFLPKRMKLGETPFIRIFDHFLMPDIPGSAWAEPVFRYIQGEYRQIIDVVYNKNLIRLMLGLLGQGLILDVGCGDGLAAEVKPAGIELFGVDLIQEMVEAANLAGEQAIVANIATVKPESLPLPFVGAMMNYVDHWLSHEERVEAFRNIYQVLSPGCRFVFNVYFPEPGWQEYYEQVLRQANFTNVIFREEKVLNKAGEEKTVYLVIAEKKGLKEFSL